MGAKKNDTTADMTYSSIYKQVDEELQEKHTLGVKSLEVVLCKIKPGHFQDLLTKITFIILFCYVYGYYHYTLAYIYSLVLQHWILLYLDYPSRP